MPHTTTDDPRRQRILSGPLFPTLLRLSAPLMVSNLMQTAYDWVNMYWLGRLGPDAVAAVTVSFPLMFLVFAIGIGFTIAATTLVAQYTGAGEPEHVATVAGQALLFTTALAVVAGVGGFFATDLLLDMMGTPAAIMADARIYLQVFFLGLGLIFSFFVFQSVLRGWGDTVTPMKLMFLSMALNVVLDPILIFGWGPMPALGVAGAAYATVFSRLVAAAIGLYLLFSGALGLRLNLVHLRPDLHLLRRVVALGAPAAGELSTRAIGLSLMTGLVARFGPAALAAFGIGSRMMSLVFLPSFALADATTAMVGQNLGARQPERAAATAWHGAGLAFALLTVLGVASAAFPAPFIRVFNTDPEVVRLGSEYLRIQGLAFGLLGAQIVLTGGLRGAGATLAALVISVTADWGFRFPLALLLAFGAGMGLSGIWWATVASLVLGMILASYWFRRGSWRRGAASSSPDTAAAGEPPVREA